MQHDVDVVVEVGFPIGTDSAWMLDQLYKAVKGDPGSRYYDFRVTRNSRCVTVTYPDGVTVDTDRRMNPVSAPSPGYADTSVTGIVTEPLHADNRAKGSIPQLAPMKFQ